MRDPTAPRRPAAPGGSPLVATLTLGCKLNQAETQAMARQLEAAGCAVVDRPAPADAYLINTCTVTGVADRKARHLIGMARRLSPSAAVVVTGCYAEREGERLRVRSGADVVIGNREKEGAVAAVLARVTARRERAGIARAAAGRTRAFLKIQEGCDDACAFCIVPRVRGRERAVPIAEVVREAQAREAAGALEVVLTGTQPGAYGRDREDGTSAARLLEALLAATTLPRIRYSSVQPQDLSDAFLGLWQDGRLCRHFHLALQSGSDRMLRRMRRRYDLAAFHDAVTRIRAAVPGAAVTTDVIVGFPGESEADFAATLEACRTLAFTRVHVFPYSSRPGTGAALLTDDVSAGVKRARLQAVEAVARASAQAYAQRLVTTVQPVLIEARGVAVDEGAAWRGLTDTYVLVHVPGRPAGPDLGNRLVAVRIDRADGGALHGRVLA